MKTTDNQKIREARKQLGDTFKPDSPDPIKEAKQMREAMEKYGLNQTELAAAIGKSRSSVANSLRLLSLSPDILSLVTSRKTRERQNRNHGLYSEQRFQPRIPRYAPQNGTRVRHKSDRYGYGKQRQNTHRLLLNRRFGENLRGSRPCRILCRTRIIRAVPDIQ